MPNAVNAEIRVTGVKEFDTGLEALKDRLREAAENIVSKGALIIADAAKDLYRPRPAGSQRTSHLSGRIYFNGAPPYQAVPPNPTIRSGATRNSIRPLKISPIGTDTWMSTTGATTSYEGYPELGTRFIRIPFPVIKNGLMKSLKDIGELAEEEYAAAIEEVA